MLDLEDALQAVREHIQPTRPHPVSLDEALGLVLAEDVVADTDSPPFDKSSMDGFAVRSADLRNPPTRLRLVGEVTAGRVFPGTVGPGEAVAVMTGAPVPAGADAVVPVEQAEVVSSGEAVVLSPATPVDPGLNVVRRGTSIRQGDVVLQRGRLLRPQELGALAEMGRASVLVFRRPQAAVLATGDELVPVDATPGPGQIRNSNQTMLVAQLRRCGAVPVALGIARDNRDDLRRHIVQGLQYDLLLLSGGVSAGRLDLVPSELEAAGVRNVFHKVRMRPGKPLWFGVFTPAGQTEHRCYVFGLPGNPVSSMVCFELFVRTAVRRLMGVQDADPRPLLARLAVEHRVEGQRPTFHPSRLQWLESGPQVTPLRWRGSFDLQSAKDANALVFFPSGGQTYPAGTKVRVLVWD